MSKIILSQSEIPAPDLSLNLIDGTNIGLSDYRGNVVVLQFAASWCYVCTRERPHLEEDVWEKFKSDRLVLIRIDRDR
jgi:peroxiredoxin